MFKTLTIKPDRSTPLDIGFLAECLLFYQQVILIIWQDSLPTLVNNCDVGILIELIKSGQLRICIRENALSTSAKPLSDGQILNDVVVITSNRIKVETVLYDGLFAATGRQGYSKRTTSRLLPYVDIVNYDPEVCNQVISDLSDETYVKYSIIEILKAYDPSATLSVDELDYDFTRLDQGFIFRTNLNYEHINHAINPRVINESILIHNILEARGDFSLASDLGSEVSTSEINSLLMKLKFKLLYKKTTQSQDNIFQFNKHTLNNGFAIREAINDRDKSFSDFLPVLYNANKFKEWLIAVPENNDIIDDYYKESLKGSWVDKLPTKAIRWSIFTGAGLALENNMPGSTLAGLGISAADTFFLDRILRGWNPSVFIKDELTDFVK